MLSDENNNNTLALTRANVVAAHALIKPHIHYTPVQTNSTLSTLASTPQTSDALKGTAWEGQDPANPKIRLFFKCENFQRIGAFKVRGAFHAVKRLIERTDGGMEEVRKTGVVTHSSGILTSQSSRFLSHHVDAYVQATTRKPSPSPPKPSQSPPTSSCPPSPLRRKYRAQRRKTP
jgi:hypothetical protein